MTWRKIRAILQLRQESQNLAVPAHKSECFIIEKLNLQKISHTAAKAFGALLIISGIIIDVISMFLIFSSSFSAFGTLTIIGTIAFLIGLAIISNS